MMFVFRALTSRYHGESSGSQSDPIGKDLSCPNMVTSGYVMVWVYCYFAFYSCHVLLPVFVFFPTCPFLVPAFAPQIYSVFLLLFSVAFWFVFWYFTLVVSWILVSLFVTCPPFAFLEHI